MKSLAKACNFDHLRTYFTLLQFYSNSEKNDLSESSNFIIFKDSTSLFKHFEPIFLYWVPVKTHNQPLKIFKFFLPHIIPEGYLP